MKQPNSSECSLLMTLLILMFPGSGPAFGQDLPRGSPETRALELLALLGSVEGTAQQHPRVHKTAEGYLRFLMAPRSTHFRAQGATPHDAADGFLARWRNLFVNESAAIAFDAVRVKTAESRTYIRYQQTYAGLEVFGAQMIIQVNRVGGIEAVISDITRDTTELDTEKVSLKPSIDSSIAQKRAVEFLAAQHPELGFEATSGTLMVFCPSVVGNTATTQLVWRTEVGNVGDPMAKELVLVDAHTGETALHYSLIYDAMNRAVWDHEPEPDVIYTDQDPPTEPGEPNDCWRYMEDFYDFYWHEHGRDSYDGNGDFCTGTLAP